MNDILFGNNNQLAIKRLAQKSYQVNARRNGIVMIALALTAFMITTVFSLGCSYLETFQMQQIRLMGTTADMAITHLTSSQMEEIKKSGLVETLGINQRLGSVDEADIGNALLGLSWLDETEWERHRLPALSDVQGDYPRTKNEVMLPTWALDKLGIAHPQIGMAVTLTYQLGQNSQDVTDEFVLSGYYTDYSVLRVGYRGSVYVSAIFANQTGLPFSDVSSGMVSFAGHGDAKRLGEKLKTIVNFTEGQTLEMVPSIQNDWPTLIVAMIFGTIAIAVSGYLLVANILYISVAKDTRFYGQLKTIGVTKRQIKKLVRWQVIRTAIFSIPLGLLAGAAVSFIMVPFGMKMMYATHATLGINVSFSPAIFSGAAVFTFLTALTGSIKPAKIAASLSPIAAFRYNDVTVKTTKAHKSRRLKLSRMAWANIWRNPKSATLTFVSLFWGLMLFLIASGLLLSLDVKNFVSRWGEGDFVVTYGLHEKENLITEDRLREIEALEGIENIRITYSASPQTTMTVVYSDAVFGQYIGSLNGQSGLDFSDAQTRKNYTDNFYSGVYGIEAAYVRKLNKTLAQPIDLQAFEKGEVVLLAATTDASGQPLIQPGQAITVMGQTGAHTFTVANGFLDADFQSGRGKGRGTAPDLYISREALKKLSPEVKICRLAFDTTHNQEDARILAQLQTLTSSVDGLIIQSRYERGQEIESYLFTARVLAMGLSSVLLLIGIINFVNTLFVSVHTRKQEWATLESIGLTKKQMRRILLFEGFYRQSEVGQYSVSYAPSSFIANGPR